MFTNDEFGVKFFKAQNNMIWTVDEFNLYKDVKNYSTVLNDTERQLIEIILRFFTRSDEHLGSFYQDVLPQHFNKPEELGIRMMFAAFANIENVHILAYSHLTETLGFTKEFYSRFLDCEYMKDRDDEMSKKHTLTPSDLVTFSLCYEGISLFSMFVILLSYDLIGYLPSIGRIVALSMNDENLHVLGMCRLCNYCGLSLKRDEIEKILRDFVEKEKRYIKKILSELDYQQELHPTIQDVIRKLPDYWDWLVSYRLKQYFNEKTSFDGCPYDWLAAKVNYEHVNFLNSTVTEYRKVTIDSDAYDFVDKK